MPRPLRRTTYRENSPPHQMRPGAATRAEVSLDFESYYQPLLEAAASVRGGVRLATTGLTGNRRLTIRTRETFDDGSFGDTGVQQMEHTPWMQFVDATAALDPAQTMLAAVVFVTGANCGKVTSVALSASPAI